MKQWLVAWWACLGLVVAVAQPLQPPEVAAKSFVLVEIGSGQLLAERQADARVDPASLTKLMTAWLVFDALRQHKLALDQPLAVSERAWAERKGGGSLMFIDTTMKPKVDELIKGMVVVSGNDAAVALAEGVSGSLQQFVAAMNRQAQAWGLTNTQFMNVTGLTEAGHYSSARDLAVMAGHLLRDFPEHYASYYSQKQYAFNNIRQDNRNMLLGRDPSVDGMKTGYTDAAGYCLVASAQRDFPNGTRRMLSVVLGTASREARATESQKLLNWGFLAWDAVRLFEPGKAAVSVPVWKGRAALAQLGVPGGVVVSVPRGDAAKIKTSIERSDPLVAPLAKGQRVGSLKVNGPTGTLLATIPLQVLEPVEQAGLLGRAWDSIRLWIK